jgi:hypothetical protein
MAMTAPKRHTRELVGAINPDSIFRTDMAEELFGFGPQQTRQKIKNDELPMPSPLTASSRIGFWTGQQILDHRAKMEELKLAKHKALPPPKTTPAKIKKVKLRKRA